MHSLRLSPALVALTRNNPELQDIRIHSPWITVRHLFPYEFDETIVERLDDRCRAFYPTLSFRCFRINGEPLIATLIFPRMSLPLFVASMPVAELLGLLLRWESSTWRGIRIALLHAASDFQLKAFVENCAGAAQPEIKRAVALAKQRLDNP